MISATDRIARATRAGHNTLADLRDERDRLETLPRVTASTGRCECDGPFVYDEANDEIACLACARWRVSSCADALRSGPPATFGDSA